MNNRTFKTYFRFTLIIFLGVLCLSTAISAMKRTSSEFDDAGSETTEQKKTSAEENTTQSNPTSQNSVNPEQKSPVAQEQIKLRRLTSINQTEYETSEYNIFDGYKLCGLFALYNAICMLEDAQTGSIKDFTDLNSFNDWMQSDEALKTAVEKTKKNNANNMLHDVSDFVIHDYLLDTKKQNICYITYLEFLNRARNPNGNLIKAYECVETFRQKQTPQAILLLISRSPENHWIAIVISKKETWVMDSLKDSSVTHYVKLINKFFRTEAITSKEERRAITRNQNQENKNEKNQIDLTN